MSGKMERMVNSIERFCDKVETVNKFCYLGGKLNATGGCGAATKGMWRVVAWK